MLRCLKPLAPICTIEYVGALNRCSVDTLQSVASYSARAETALTYARESAEGAWRLKMHQAVRCQHVTLYLRRYIFLFLFVENKIPNKIFFFRRFH